MPAHLKCWVTTRLGGVSTESYGTWNLGDHVEDLASAVDTNRQLLASRLQLPDCTQWLTQVHGVGVVYASSACENPAKGDLVVLNSLNTAGVVLTADCLPVVLTDQKSEQVAVIHAGWKGLAQGILDVAVSCFEPAQKPVLAWFAPCVLPRFFEVGVEVYDRFVQLDAVHAQAFWTLNSGNNENRKNKKCVRKYHGNLLAIAVQQLRGLGVRQFYGFGYNQVFQMSHFYSYRQSRVTGRFATVVMLC